MKQFNYDSVIFNHEYPFSHLLFYSGIKTNVDYSFNCKKSFLGEQSYMAFMSVYIILPFF